MKRVTALWICGVLALLVAVGWITGSSSATSPTGIHTIRHVVVIMQENRSFDEYFGTYRGADGISGGICVPAPLTGGCIKPYHDSNDVNYRGPHTNANARADIDGGKMDGFLAEPNPCRKVSSPKRCDVMGYKTRADIPNYWAYADNFVLQDHMFEPNASNSPAGALIHGLWLVGRLHRSA